MRKMLKKKRKHSHLSNIPNEQEKEEKKKFKEHVNTHLVIAGSMCAAYMLKEWSAIPVIPLLTYGFIKDSPNANHAALIMAGSAIFALGDKKDK